MILNIENVNKFYNGNQILKDIFLSINDNDRIGLIGQNGCGKSTLLKIITGEEEFDKTFDGKGSISFSTDKNIGILKQNSGLVGDNNIDEEMHTVFADLLLIKEKLSALENAMANGDLSEETASEYAHLSTFFEARDGYNIDVKINTVLNGMGFGNTPKTQIISTLSGGEKTRLALAKLLLESPSLLILDEPTNHLDLKTLAWLEEHLLSYKGALLIVSHDRYFLDKICNRICEIEFGELISYKGDYSSYHIQKEMRIERQMKEYEAQQNKISELQDYIDRNKVRASTANMAKSRQVALDKIEKIDKPHTYKKPPKINLEFDITPPKEILFVENLEISVGGKKLVSSIDMTVRRGEKIGIVGKNGTGKSTLLKLLQNKIPLTKGTIRWCANSKISYFEQESTQLDFNNTVIDELHRRHPRNSEQSIRTILGSVLLTGENVFKRTGVISGGERAKLCFAIMMMERGNILVLDEPTNHLDIIAKEVLEDALSRFEGTIILVSHDRYLLNKIADKIVELDSDKATEYAGNYDFYSERKKLEEIEIEREISLQKAEKQKNESTKVYKTKEMRSLEAKKKAEMKKLEERLFELENDIAIIEEEMTQPEIFSDYELMNEKCLHLEKLKEEYNETFEIWAT